MKTKNILRIFCAAIFVLGAITMKAQTVGENLLLNPGLENPDNASVNGMPNNWSAVEVDWYAGYYNSSDVGTNPPNNTNNRRGDGSFFSGTANGASIFTVLTGKYTGRLPGGETGGMFQIVNGLIEGETYEFGCDFAVKSTNPANQIIKGTEGIKILDKDGNDLPTGAVKVSIPESAANTTQIVIHLSGEITIPAGFTQLRFQIDQENFAVLPGGRGNAPLICFDQCYFRKLIPNLLLNPGFEETYNDKLDQTSMPDDWTLVPASWYELYYAGDNPQSKAPNGIGNRVSPMTGGWLASGAFGGGLAGIATGHYAARIPGSAAGGMYQVVSVIPDATYEYGCDIAFRVDANSQTIKNDQTVKILSEDGLTLYSEALIDIDNTTPSTAPGSNPMIYLVPGVKGVVTIPPGVTKVRFQVDQKNFGGTASLSDGNAPVMVWDECYVRPKTLVIGAEETKTKSNYINGDYDDIIFQSNDNSTGQLIIPEGDDLTVNGVVKLRKTFADIKKWYPIGFPFDVASVRSDADGYDDYDLATYNDPDNLNSSYDGSGDYWLKTYDADKDEFIYYPSGSENIAQGGYILEVPNPFLGSTFTFTSGTGVVLSNSDVLDIEENFYKLTNNPSVANLPVINDAQNNFYAFGVKFSNNFGLLSSTYTLKPFESLVVANNQTELRSDLGTGEITSSPSLNLPNDNAVATEYYNLLGVKVAEPVKGNIYLVKTIYKSGKTSVVKQYINHN